MLKIILLFTIFCSCFNLTIFSQKKSRKIEEKDIRDFKNKFIKIPAADSSASFNGITGIIISDNRSDTSCIGLFQEKKPMFLVVDGGLQKQSSLFIGRYAKFEGGAKSAIVMVITKCWLTDDLNLSDYFIRKVRVTDPKVTRINSLLFKAEFYLKRDSGYYALYRYDSTFSLPSTTVTDSTDMTGLKKIFTNNVDLSEAGPALMRTAIINCLAPLKTSFSRVSGILESKKKFSWSDIQAHIYQKYDLPILKDSEFVSGVYMTFDEFRRNDPSYRNFEIDHYILFIKNSDGKKFAEANAWGYCKDSVLYIKLRSNFFKLQRRDYSYYVYGWKEGKMSNTYSSPGSFHSGTGNITPGLSWGGNTVIFLYKPFHLDWDRGELE